MDTSPLGAHPWRPTLGASGEGAPSTNRSLHASDSLLMVSQCAGRLANQLMNARTRAVHRLQDRTE